MAAVPKALPARAAKKRRGARRPPTGWGEQLALRGVPKLALVLSRSRALEAEPPPVATKRRRAPAAPLQLPFILPDRSFPKGRVIERFELSPAEKGRALALSRRHLPIVDRPRTRAECQPGVGIRPCPWVGCKHHLYLDITNYASVKVNFPGLEEGDHPRSRPAPWPVLADEASSLDLARMPATCALDVAERHQEGLHLDEVGAFMNLTMERIRQLEIGALAKLRKVPGALELLRRYAERDGETGDGDGPG